MNGVIIVNKADNITSQKVVNMIKHKFNKLYKVGHYGTLDPKATGVLPIAVGKATKLFDFMQDKIKVYRAVFRFGTETSTLDSEGDIIKTDGNIPTLKDITGALKCFIGTIEQIPPKYSANMINGVRAYDLARKNIDFELKTKVVEVLDFRCLRQLNDKDYLFEIVCGSGTYIRSLCRDLAYKLKTFAYMPVLIRIKSGIFDIKDSVTYNELLKNDDLSKFVLPLDKVIDLPSIDLKESDVKFFSNGMTSIISKPDGKYKVMHNDTLLGIGVVNKNRLKMEIKLDD